MEIKRRMLILNLETKKEIKLKKKEKVKKELELIKSVIKTKINLKDANKNFEYADGDLIDYYAYKIKAEQAKLDYLIKKVKKAGIALDMINEIKVRNENIGVG